MTLTLYHVLASVSLIKK